MKQRLKIFCFFHSLTKLVQENSMKNVNYVWRIDYILWKWILDSN